MQGVVYSQTCTCELHRIVVIIKVNNNYQHQLKLLVQALTYSVTSRCGSNYFDFTTRIQDSCR